MSDMETEEGFDKESEINYLMNPDIVGFQDFELAPIPADNPEENAEEYEKLKEKSFLETMLYRKIKYEILSDGTIKRTIFRSKYDKRIGNFYPEKIFTQKEFWYFMKFKDLIPIYKKINENVYYTDMVEEFFHKISNFQNFPVFYYHNLDFDIKFMFDKIPKYIYTIEKDEAGKQKLKKESLSFHPIQVGGKLASYRLYKVYKRNFFICKRCIIKIKKKNKNRKNKLEYKFKIETYGKSLICPFCNKNDETFIPTYTKTYLEFRDTYILLVNKLEKIGKTIHTRKGSIDYDNECFAKKEAYMKRDIEILSIAIKKLLKFVNLTFGFEEEEVEDELIEIFNEQDIIN